MEEQYKQSAYQSYEDYFEDLIARGWNYREAKAEALDYADYWDMDEGGE